jgi:hypothetical protein
MINTRLPHAPPAVIGRHFGPGSGLPGPIAFLGGGAPPVLVAFGDYDAMRLRQFAAEQGGALVVTWKLFGAASLFSEAAE